MKCYTDFSTMSFSTYTCITYVVLYVLLSSSFGYELNRYTRANLCNKTLQLGSGPYAGIINFEYGADVEYDSYECTMTLIADIYSQFSYTFQDSFKLSTNGSCNSRVYIEDNFSASWYCVSFPRHEMITESNMLILKYENTGKTDTEFEIIFNLFSQSPCYSSDVRCDNSRCINRNLACSHSYNFCGDGTEACSDIKADSMNIKSLVGGVVTTIIIIVILVVGLSIKHKNKSCFHRHEAAIPRTAAEVFTIPGDDSDTEAGPIDYDQFAPPPEYSSLENIHDITSGVGNTNTDTTDGPDKDTEPPPLYHIVISNQEEYKVTLHI